MVGGKERSPSWSLWNLWVQLAVWLAGSSEWGWCRNSPFVLHTALGCSVGADVSQEMASDLEGYTAAPKSKSTDKASLGCHGRMRVSVPTG